MPKKEREREDRAKTQKTKKGYEIPVPKRGDFLRDLKKAAEPDAQDGEESDVGDSRQSRKPRE